MHEGGIKKDEYTQSDAWVPSIQALVGVLESGILLFYMVQMVTYYVTKALL